MKGQTLRLVDAAEMLELSDRQAKTLAVISRKGAKGLQHRSAGRSSKRAEPEKFRRKVLQLVREKYSGTEQERFGPTLAAEHLAEDDGLEVGEETGATLDVGAGVVEPDAQTERVQSSHRRP